ncbi:MAG: BON domain-containing protein [Bacteriovorax sp.]|nr:BON domain-containing protein [Bacteriovorax sp.]
MGISKKIAVLIALIITFENAFSASPQYENIQQSIGQTADSQTRGNKSDIETTRKLREVIMANNQLSTYAHNIKIITLKNTITLKGHVASKAERTKIENLAKNASGTKKIYNQLTY